MKIFEGVTLTVKRLEVGWCVRGWGVIKDSLQKYLEMGWAKAKYVRRRGGGEVERVTQIGTKGTRIENKGA